MPRSHAHYSGNPGAIICDNADVREDFEAPGPSSFEQAQRAAIFLNAEERERFAAWFKEWHFLVTPEKDSK